MRIVIVLLKAELYIKYGYCVVTVRIVVYRGTWNKWSYRMLHMGYGQANYISKDVLYPWYIRVSFAVLHGRSFFLFCITMFIDVYGGSFSGCIEVWAICLAILPPLLYEVICLLHVSSPKV